MIKNDIQISSLIYGDAVQNLATSKNIGLSEARSLISEMSFNEYCKLIEAPIIVPPSGQTIGPQGSQGSQNQTTSGSSQVKSIWPGKGTPIETGMTVGLKGPNGVPVPGQVSQVDMASKGVKVKNPTTGQDEWMNTDTLQPFMASGSGTPTNQPNQPTTTVEDTNDLARLRELAGIKENCSAGATGAGAIAVAPAAMGTMKRRQFTDEKLKKEYTPEGPPKTIVGDTKPHQASGELSANLVARGKKSAGRTNNGMKK
jgi:hypothetical protein